MNSDFFQAVKRMVERGNPPKLRSSSPGSSIHQAAAVPTHPLPVQDVSIQRQLNEAAWSVTWQAVAGASSYEIQTNPDPGRLLRWFTRGRVSEPATQIQLSAGANRVWLRVRACGLAGAGPWSDPVLLRKNERFLERAA